MMMNNKIINWFIPANKIRGRTNVEIARLFVFTHLFGPFIAQPMGIYLYYISPELSAPLMVMVFGIYSFALLPFVLKWTGNMNSQRCCPTKVWQAHRCSAHSFTVVSVRHSFHG